MIEAQIDEMAGDKAAAEAKYRRAVALDKDGLRTTVAVAEGLRRLGKADEARELLKTYGEKYSDAVVMDGLIGPNAPMPKPPTRRLRHRRDPVRHRQHPGLRPAQSARRSRR